MTPPRFLHFSLMRRPAIWQDHRRTGQKRHGTPAWMAFYSPVRQALFPLRLSCHDHVQQHLSDFGAYCVNLRSKPVFRLPLQEA